MAIVATNFWLGQRAQSYFDDAIAARDTRVAAVENLGLMLLTDKQFLKSNAAISDSASTKYAYSYPADQLQPRPRGNTRHCQRLRLT